MHPWRQAAGGWPLGAYARSAPYPRGTVVAQDFFRSGLLPADTDFRVFEASLLRCEKLCPVRCSNASVTGVIGQDGVYSRYYAGCCARGLWNRLIQPSAYLRQARSGDAPR